MIANTDLQNSYNNFYTNLSNYILDFDDVEHLAEIEIQVYTSFPNFHVINKHLSPLGVSLNDVCKDDAELKESFDDFTNIVNEGKVDFMRLEKVREI